MITTEQVYGIVYILCAVILILAIGITIILDYIYEKKGKAEVNDE